MVREEKARKAARRILPAPQSRACMRTLRTATRGSGFLARDHCFSRVLEAGIIRHHYQTFSTYQQIRWMQYNGSDETSPTESAVRRSTSPVGWLPDLTLGMFSRWQNDSLQSSLSWVTTNSSRDIVSQICMTHTAPAANLSKRQPVSHVFGIKEGEALIKF